MKGWHFSTGVLGYDDGRTIVAGETHKVPGPVKLCARGLHASKRALDALSYAPGAIASWVELSGDIVHDNDKSVATRRTYLAVIDATDVLRKFAAECAMCAQWEADFAPAAARTATATAASSAAYAATATAASSAAYASAAAVDAAAAYAAAGAAADAAFAAAYATAIAYTTAYAAARAALAATAAADDAQNCRLEYLLRAALEV